PEAPLADLLQQLVGPNERTGGFGDLRVMAIDLDDVRLEEPLVENRVHPLVGPQEGFRPASQLEVPATSEVEVAIPLFGRMAFNRLNVDGADFGWIDRHGRNSAWLAEGSLCNAKLERLQYHRIPRKM